MVSDLVRAPKAESLAEGKVSLMVMISLEKRMPPLGVVTSALIAALVALGIVEWQSHMTRQLSWVRNNVKHQVCSSEVDVWLSGGSNTQTT